MLIVAGALLGAAGSLHCVLMCGPLAGAVATGGGTWRARAISFVVYHGGRGLVYLALAVTAALLGRVFVLAGVGGALSVTCGVLMLAAAIPTRLAPRRLIGFALRSLGHASVRAHALARTRPLGARFLSGIVNGLLPCGLTYAAALAAAALHGVPAAMLFMTGFWAGTMPALGIVSLSAVTLRRMPAKRLSWVPPVAMAIAGLLLIARGLEPLRQPAESHPATALHHHRM
jgi:sulfite exporter TauE/SafE